MKVTYCDFCGAEIGKEGANKTLFGGDICGSCASDYRSADKLIEDKRAILRDKLSLLDREASALANEWRKKKGALINARRKGEIKHSPSLVDEEARSKLCGSTVAAHREDWWTK